MCSSFRRSLTVKKGVKLMPCFSLCANLGIRLRESDTTECDTPSSRMSCKTHSDCFRLLANMSFLRAVFVCRLVCEPCVPSQLLLASVDPRNLHSLRRSEARFLALSRVTPIVTRRASSPYSTPYPLNVTLVVTLPKNPVVLFGKELLSNPTPEAAPRNRCTTELCSGYLRKGPRSAALRSCAQRPNSMNGSCLVLLRNFQALFVCLNLRGDSCGATCEMQQNKHDLLRASPFCEI